MPTQITPKDIQVQDINGLTVTSNILPSDFVASEQAYIDKDNVIITTETENIAQETQAITDAQADMDRRQALIVASQINIDAATADVAAHQTNIDAVTKVLPSLAVVVSAQNALPAQSVQIGG